MVLLPLSKTSWYYEPLECALCRMLDCECDFPEMVARSSSSGAHDPALCDGTTHYQDPGIDYEAIMQYLTFADMHSHLSTVFQSSGPPFAPVSGHEIEGHAMVVIRIPDGGYRDSHAALIRNPPSPTTEQSGQVSCPMTACLWGPCGAMISCGSVPKHFRDIHEIKNIREDQLVSCKWKGCFAEVIRKNFARHIRETHLDHVRDKGHLS